jgi:hypothetical protein
MNRQIEVGKNIRPKQPVYLDDLDKLIKQRVDKQGIITLSELRRDPDLGKLPYSTLHYRIASLATEQLIRVERTRKLLVCYSIEG